MGAWESLIGSLTSTPSNRGTDFNPEASEDKGMSLARLLTGMEAPELDPEQSLASRILTGARLAPPRPEEKGVTKKASKWDDLISGSMPKAQQEPGAPVGSEFIVKGLMDRGLPQHIAEGFAMNMKDESGLNPGINEVDPIVEGSRGGYGLYQLTGPRRRQYESFAQERGTDFSDPEAQLDFLMWELENTERGAAKSIFETETAGEAGAAIVNKFLRPAEEYRAQRASKYLGGGAKANPPPPRPRNKLWLDF